MAFFELVEADPLFDDEDDGILCPALAREWEGLTLAVEGGALLVTVGGAAASEDDAITNFSAMSSPASVRRNL